MGSIYEALLRASAERESSKEIEALPDIDGSALPTGDRMEDEEMMVLIEAVESLGVQRRNKVIQFVGSRDGLRSSSLARGFALTTASAMDLSVVLIGDGRPPSGAEKTPSREFESGGSNFGSPREDVDKVFGEVREANLFSYHSEQVTAHGAVVIGPPNRGSIWELMRKSFDLVVIETARPRGSSDHPMIHRDADSIVLVFESDIVEPSMEAGVEDVGLASVLDLVAQGAIIPRHVARCMGWTLLLLMPAELALHE